MLATMAASPNKFTAFGTRLAQLIEAAGLTQGELARRTGIKQQSISGWVRGINVPGMDRAAKLAQALGVEPGELFTPDLLGGEAKTEDES